METKTDCHGLTPKAKWILQDLAPLYDAILQDAILEWDITDRISAIDK